MQPPGAVLTVGQIAATPSSEYPDADISSGAIAARLAAGTTPGIQATRDGQGRLAATLTPEA